MQQIKLGLSSIGSMGSSSVDWKRLNSPFPPPPRSLPAFSPSLHFHELDVQDTELHVGAHFVLNWDTAGGGHLRVRHVDDPGKLQWATHPGRGFVVAARGEHPSALGPRGKPLQQGGSGGAAALG